MNSRCGAIRASVPCDAQPFGAAVGILEVARHLGRTTRASTCPRDDSVRSFLKPRRVLDDASSLGRWRGALRGVEARSLKS